ncbi:MAG TPA: ATP synthase F1 subunit epsilon [Bacteroidales bacterium]|nr:ATP synthase F1 subunit epsilon [Bacteroidales bacterium]
MKLEIITPEQIVFSGEVSLVTVPGTNGSFTILKDHAPIISSLEKGLITYRVDEKDTQVECGSGFVEVNNNSISICVEETEK